MTRALTAPELALLRSNGQGARLLILVDAPETVFACQVNEVLASMDRISSVAYTSETGTAGDVAVGMTVLFGSSAGGYDLGMGRISAVISGGRVYFDPISAPLEAGVHISILNEFGIHATPLPSYTNQHSNFSPVPVLGADQVVFIDEEVEVALDASSSWCFDSSITTYAWSASAGSFDNASIAAPTLTLDAPGRVVVKLTVTAANGKSSIARRVIHAVLAEDTLEFYVSPDGEPYSTPNGELYVVSSPTQGYILRAVSLENCAGSLDDGGWRFGARIYNQGDLDLRPGVLVQLISQDFYDLASQSVCVVPSGENIVVSGWVLNATHEKRIGDGEQVIECGGPAFLMQQIPSVPWTVSHTAGTPASFGEMQLPTADRALYSLLIERSNAALVLDFIPSENTVASGLWEAGGENLWVQAREIGDRALLNVCCNRYGQLFVFQHPNLIGTAARAALPIVQAISDDDLGDLVEIERSIEAKSQIDLSAIMLDDDRDIHLYALAPGRSVARFGDVTSLERVAVSNQSNANDLAGLIYGRLGSSIKSIGFALEQNNRAIDVCPAQYVDLDISADLDPAGLGYDGRAVPNSVAYSHNPSTLEAWINVTCEPESSIGQGIIGDAPEVEIFEPSPYEPIPDIVIPDVPPLTDGTAPVTGTVSGVRALLLLDDTYGLWVATDINTGSPHWRSLNGSLDSTEKAELRFFGARRFGGSQVHAITPSGYYMAASLSSGLVLKKDYEWLKDQLAYTEAVHFMNVGCKPYSNIVAVTGRMSGSTSGTDDGFIFVGHDGDLTKQAALGADRMGINCSIHWDENNELNVFAGNGAAQNPYSQISTNDGATFANYSNGGFFGAPAARRIWLSQTYLMPGYKSTDGGRTLAALGTDPGGWTYFTGADGDPTGQYLMVALNYLKKSSDGGATWSAFFAQALAADFAHVINLGTSQRWLVITLTGRIWYTADFGSNFTEVTGDLLSYLPLGQSPATRIIQAEAIF